MKGEAVSRIILSLATTSFACAGFVRSITLNILVSKGSDFMLFAHLARMPQPVKAQIAPRLQQLAIALDQSGWLGYWGHAGFDHRPL